jgi:signal transduction histidine kinase
VRPNAGEPAEWVVCCLHDVTDRENLARLRDQFLSAAAHSLKTPIAVMKANAQALLPILSSQHRQIAASLERQCDRIDRLVQNLLVLARARSKTLELHLEVVELQPLIEQIARESVWSYRHEVRVDVAGSPHVRADRERLALVIRDLMHEASRLSPADSLLTLNAGADGGQVTIGVRYRALSLHERATELYDDYEDIGMGRSLVRTITEAHGGSLSEEAAGAEVILQIRLPQAA